MEALQRSLFARTSCNFEDSALDTRRVRLTPRAVRTLKTSEAAVFPERQPEHAACLGAPLRLPDADAHRGQAPPLHARRDRGAARRAEGGPLDLLGDLTRAREADAPTRRCSSARSPTASWTARTARWRRRSRCAPSSAPSTTCCCPRCARSPPSTATRARPGRSPRAGPPTGSCAHGASRRRRCAPNTVLVGDATRDELDPEALETAALTLFTIRGGASVLTLPVAGLAGLGDVLRNFQPATRSSSRARTPATTRSRAGPTRCARSTGPLPVALFRRGERRAKTSTHAHAGRCACRCPG